jgi:hypothetical protein
MVAQTPLKAKLGGLNSLLVLKAYSIKKQMRVPLNKKRQKYLK